jgi:hypothetical protein
MITSTLIGSSNTNIFLSQGENAITAVFLCNTSESTNAFVDLFVVSAAGVIGPTSQIMKSLSLPAGETFVLDTEKLILEDQAALWAVSNVGSIISSTVSSVAIS